MRNALIRIPLACAVALVTGVVALAQCELANLVAPPGSDRFGAAVGIAGTVALVGAPDETVDGSRAGAVYAFERRDEVWVETQRLAPFDPDDPDYIGQDQRFGGALALSADGDTAVVGAFFADGVAANAGAAYVFERGVLGWVEVQKVVAPDGGVLDGFGASVALDGGRLIVGAPYHDGAALLSGAAYVFVRTDAGWVHEAKLSAPDAAFFDWFGESVAIAGEWAAVGVPRDDAATGAVYVFRFGAAGWSPVVKLVAPGARPGDELGRSVALAGGRLVVGAPGAWFGERRAGRVHVFREESSGWTPADVLGSAGGADGDRFGHAAAIAGDHLVVGAPNAVGAGAAFAFAGEPRGWERRGRLSGARDRPGDQRGSAVATDGERFLVGGLDVDAGVFALATPGVRYCVATPSSTGVPATIVASGCDRVDVGQLTLAAAPLPRGEPGLFLLATGVDQVPFGDGYLCLRRPLLRSPPLAVDRSGRLTWRMDFESPPATRITPGATWRAQAWFRDRAAGGAGWNLSDALELEFAD